MARYLIDTDVMVDVSRRIAAATYLDSLDDITISIITAHELIVGARNQRDADGDDQGAESRDTDLLKPGAPGETRTPDLLVRSQPLYPTELRARARLHYSDLIAAPNAPELSCDSRAALWGAARSL